MARQVVDMMIDFETLGVSRDAVLLSSGICLFTPTETLVEHYQEYDISGQISDGQSVDKSTVDWWRRTDQEEFSRLLYNRSGVHPPSDLNEFMKIFKSGEYKLENVWSRGSTDFEILQYHLDEELPYWMAKDCRTLDVLQKMSGKNNHNALSDIRHQVEHVQEVLRKWNAPRVE